MPMHTRMKAKSVPMFVRSTISSMLTNALTTADEHAGQDRRDVRRPEARVHPGEDRRQKPVARHREEDARLPELEDEEHRRLRDDRAERDDADHPAGHVHVLHRHRQRLGALAPR